MGRQGGDFSLQVTLHSITLSCIGTAKSMIAVLKIPPNRRSLIQEADIEQTRKFDETQDSQEA